MIANTPPAQQNISSRADLSCRNSSVELLRMLCMVMVLLLHLNAHVMDSLCTSRTSWCWNVVESFCIVAVNVFVLISGYFSIRFSLRKVFKLYLQCLLIGLSAYGIYLWATHAVFSWHVFLGRFLTFSHNQWWFIISYLGMFFLSPILNIGAEKIKKNDFAILLVLFTILEVYFGWHRNMDGFNLGYSIIHFCYLYLLARFAALHISHKRIISLRWINLGVYLFCVLVTTLMAESRLSIFGYVWAYNNLFIIIGSLSLLLFFVSFSFYNKWINWIAASALAAYLLQEAPFIRDHFYYDWESAWISSYPALASQYAMVFVHAIALFCIAIVLDKILGVISAQLLRIYDAFERRVGIGNRTNAN